MKQLRPITTNKYTNITFSFKAGSWTINLCKKSIVWLYLFVFTFSLNAQNSTQKIMHLSFDDSYYFMMDLTKKTTNYNSIFENPFLRKLKSFHDTYGAVFSLYCYTYSPGANWNISPLKTTYAQEFIDNSDWLKLGFHNRNSKYATEDWQIRYYEDFLSVIPEMEGRSKCFDVVPRLHTFGLNTTSAFLDSLKNHADIGLKGFLFADDGRVSYCLTKDQSDYLKKNDSLYDAANDLYYFTSETRLESVKDSVAFLAQFLTPAYASRANILPIFTHEHMLSNLNGTLRPDKDYLFGRMEACIKWAIANNYKFDYPMNLIPNKTLSGSKSLSADADIITVKGNTISTKTTGNFQVFNASGVLLYRKENVSSINAKLSRGIYIVDFKGNDGIHAKEKIVI
jgi:hypothetical protein